MAGLLLLRRSRPSLPGLAVRAMSTAGDSLAEAEARVGLGVLHGMKGELDQAETNLRAAAELHDPERPGKQAEALYALGRLIERVQEEVRAALRQALVDEDIRKIDAWTARYKVATVEFSTTPYDPFFNANRPEDFAEAERLMAEIS